MLNSTLSFPSLVVDICRTELSLHDDTLAVAQALVGLTTDERLGDEQRQLLQHCRDVDTLQQADMRKDSDNYWRLLVTTAADIRVILILIARQLAMVRQHAALITPTNDSMTVAHDAAQLYAPIAHKLGLYQVKSELEDLAMKLTEHEAYYHIRAKLAATKQSREAYIQRFVAPLTARLLQTGLRFHIKGRTKSIHSIWQKMQKQQCPFEGVYDLFAIRIILNDETTDKQTLHSNAPTTLTLRKEKMQCWQAYSIVTDLYQPNTRRLRDWISVPKDNGYESLHITVRGPEQKWVEVQIRTQRMDDVAERGVAAHWRYKGVAQGGSIDDWFNSIRQHTGNNTITDTGEVYVITPKGDIWNFPKGATVLDFAYRIHTNVGDHCTGARINGRLVPVRETLHNGQQVSIVTSTTQQPKHDWLSIATTQRAKAKIRQSLKAMEVSDGQVAKEMLERRFRNRKIELQEKRLAQVVKQLGYKETTEFYKHLAEGKLDMALVMQRYTAIEDANTAETDSKQERIVHADQFQLNTLQPDNEHAATNTTQLIIGKGVKGIDYQLAKCCNPIYGDKVFGFLTSGGGVKIHRDNCPNAHELKTKYPYRIIRAQWGDNADTDYNIALRITGKDNITVVNNISHIIMHDPHTALRSINIDSHDGLFKGTLGIVINDIARLPSLIRKLKNVNGVKSVERT